MFKPESFTCVGHKDLTQYDNGILKINPETGGVRRILYISISMIKNK